MDGAGDGFKRVFRIDADKYCDHVIIPETALIFELLSIYCRQLR